ncbi:MAG: hypothetical protein NWF05_08300 [Candidatus Bathyarchaeota archaeon]|nr:hypothetical protein [Candidatus Bathyarchaeota archaeon]
MINGNKKVFSILVAVVLVASLSAACSVSYVACAQTATPTVLVTGAGGATKNFTLTELQAMPNVTGYGGFYQTNQKIVNGGLWTGVSLLHLCNEVGGISPDCTIAVTGQGTNSFTYDMVYSGLNLNLEYKTYNNITGTQQDQTQPVTVILAYQVNGTDLPSSYQPAPRLIIVGPEGLVMEGSGGRSITQLSVTGTLPTTTSSPAPTPTTTANPTQAPTPTATVLPTHTSSPSATPSPTATPEDNEGADQTLIYLIAAAVVVAIIVVVVLAFVLTRKK